MVIAVRCLSRIKFITRASRSSSTIRLSPSSRRGPLQFLFASAVRTNLSQHTTSSESGQFLSAKYYRPRIANEHSNTNPTFHFRFVHDNSHHHKRKTSAFSRFRPRLFPRNREKAEVYCAFVVLGIGFLWVPVGRGCWVPVGSNPHRNPIGIRPCVCVCVHRNLCLLARNKFPCQRRVCGRRVHMRTRPDVLCSEHIASK